MQAEHGRLTDQPHSGRPASALIPYLVALAGALTLYLLSMAPGVLWQDSGLAQVRVLRRDLVGGLGLALAHPLYYLLAFAFQALPFAESAFKTNLVSAVFGAVTVANVFVLLHGLTGCRRAALIGALSLAIAHTIWQHCALAEVYTVSTALLTAELLCLWQYDRTGRGRWLVLLFLSNGLGISNHMLASLSLACYAVTAIWLAIRGRIRPATLAFAVLAWVVGAAVYMGLIVAQIRAGGGFGATIHSALFGNFDESVKNLVPSGRQLVNSVLFLALNFPTPAVLLVLPGLASTRRPELRRFGGVLLALLAVHLAWAVRYKVPDQHTFFIPAVVLLAVLIGLGAERFLRLRSRGWAVALIAGALLPAVVYGPLPAMARGLKLNLGVTREVPYREEYAYFLHPWKTGYDGARRFAEEVHAALPEGAVLFADPTTAPPIHYLQLTGRWTKNIRVFPEMTITAESKEESTEVALREDLAAGRVYAVSPQPDYCPEWILERYEAVKEGLLYRIAARRGMQ